MERETSWTSRRHMLKFTLIVDYQSWDSTPNLSAAVREHFLLMVRTSRDLESALPVRPNPEQRQLLAASFWKHLHQPCKALGVPTKCVFQTMINLSEYVNSAGHYKGSVYGILHTRGLDQLATKLWMDRTIVVPAVSCSGSLKDRSEAWDIKARIHMMTSTYSTRIYGVAAVSNPLTGWNSECSVYNDTGPDQSITHTASIRGIAYASSRRAAIVGMCKALSATDWMRAVGTCAQDVLSRYGILQGGAIRVLEDQEILQTIPYGWQYDSVLHFPDWFEARGWMGTGGCGL